MRTLEVWWVHESDSKEGEYDQDRDIMAYLTSPTFEELLTSYSNLLLSQGPERAPRFAEMIGPMRIKVVYQ